MRICIFSPTFLPEVGGVELAVHYIAARLADLGHEVGVLTFWSRERRWGFAGAGYRVHTLPPGLGRLRGRLTPVQEYGIAVALAGLWLRWRYDVLNVHLAYPGGYAAGLLKSIVKVPTVLTCHANDVQVVPELGYGLRLQPGIDRKIRFGLKRADAVTAVSESVAIDVRGLCPDSREVYIVPNGVSADRFASIRSDIRPRFGIPAAAKIVLAVGRNHPKKGYATLVEAMSIVATRHPGVRCVIAGKDTESLIPLIRRLGLEQVVLLTGQLPPDGLAPATPDGVPPDELVALYQQSDVFTSPSLVEGFALVLPEAMMAGLPVVATDVPGNRDIVADGQNGFLVPPNDAVTLADRVDAIVGNNALRASMSAVARETARAYEWRQIAESYLRVYESSRTTAA